MRRILLLLTLAMLLLVACGGGSTEPVANNSNNDSAASTTNSTVNEEVDAAPAEEPTEAADEAAPTEEAPPATAEEETAAEPADESEAADDTADTADSGDETLYSGIDPETGLEINPDPTPYGVEFIARGEVISMNLTPQTDPEFVIRAPNGVSYRIATQGLADIFMLDGSQLKPFEYKIGMEAMATALLAEDATLSDVLTSPDFVIIALP